MAKSSRLDEHGVSRFTALLTTTGRDTTLFYAFDLICLNGARNTPPVERKERLCELVRGSGCPRLICATH